MENPELLSKDTKVCVGVLHSLLPAATTAKIPSLGLVRRLSNLVTYSRSLIVSDGLQSRESTRSIDMPSSEAMTPALSYSVSETQTPIEAFASYAQVVQIAQTQQNSHGDINWQYVAIGHQILGSALQQSQSGNTTTSRNLYIDALKYIHFGAPNDLHEAESYRASSQLNAEASDLIIDKHGPIARWHGKHERSPNVVRSSTTSIVSLIIAIFVLAMPIVADLLSRALEYERRHRVIERIVDGTSQFIKSTSDSGIAASQQVVRLGQSRLGTYCLLKMALIFNSIAEGISDGIVQSVEDQRGVVADR